MTVLYLERVWSDLSSYIFQVPEVSVSLRRTFFGLGLPQGLDQIYSTEPSPKY